MSGLKKLSRVFGRRRPETMNYRTAKQLARDDNPDIRRRLAERDDVRPEILYYLADDPAVGVRRAIAGNEKTPGQADLILARDVDEAVRSDLADKIARVVPGLSGDAQDYLYQVTIQVLEVLAEDQVERVRRIIAEALKDADNVPPGLIKRLATDPALTVSGPVLQFSPLLTEEDLLEIVASRPVAGALSAIARRLKVGERIADAIVEADQASAVAALLANDSAQIREETLDRIVDDAPEHEAWHEPLVRRPQLPARAARRLAEFVADKLLDLLQSRADLDPETARAVGKTVRERLGEKAADTAKPNGAGSDTATASVNGPEAAQDLFEKNALDDEAVDEALARGELGFVTTSLALLSGLPQPVVEKMIAAHSAKGMMALAWKAGLGAGLAAKLQLRLARIPPNAVLNPSGGFEYPLSPEEMEWQIDFFASLSK